MIKFSKFIVEEKEVEIIINLGSDENDYAEELKDTYSSYGVEVDLSSGGIVLFFKTNKKEAKKIMNDLNNDYNDIDVISESEGSGFKNSFKISQSDAKKVSKNYGQKWEKDDSLWLMYDAKEHIMTYDTKKGELYSDFKVSDIEDMIENRPVTEKAFKFYDKTQLYRALPKERGSWLNWTDDGKWTIDSSEGDNGSIKVDDILDYYSLDYNVRTSITVALKDLEKGKFEANEVEAR